MRSFQSTLPRGERRQIEATYRDAQEFQSTLPRGERLEYEHVDISEDIISIHAPARGATAAVAIFEVGNTHFNPRSREGSDE